MSLAYSVILFDSTHDAIRAEKTLKAVLPVTLMPVPRQFSASCGISLRFATELRPQIEELLQRHQLAGRIEPLNAE